MKESSENAMEVNNELRLNVDEQQDDKTLKVKPDIDYSDEVQEITAARTPMKINRPVCVTCNRTLALKNGCKKNLSMKSTLSSCEIFVAKYSSIERK